MIRWARDIIKLLPLVGYAIAIHVATQRTWAADRPNVLLLRIDDLRPELNCY